MDADGLHEFAINVELFKRCWIYQMFVPNADGGGGGGGGGRNVYRLSLIAFVGVVQLLIVFGNLGLIVETDYAPDMVDLFLIAYGNIHNCLSLWKLGVLLLNVDVVRRLFDVSRSRFLVSDRCRAHARVALREHRDRTVRLTDMYYLFCRLVIVQWIVFPLATNALARHHSDDDVQERRLINVINLPFPVNTSAYNRYYWAFYAAETVLAVYVIYCILMIDIVVLSFGWVIVAQYGVLASAFGQVARRQQRGLVEDRTSSSPPPPPPPFGNGYDVADDYGDFRAILFDQLQLFSQLTSFYTIAKPIVLMYVFITSSLIIILMYAFVMICMTPESFSVLGVFKVGTTVFFLCFQLYLYCYLFDNMNDKTEYVSFGIYSCDWTRMDLKFKKLLLAATRMSDANRIVLKASPNKIINMQLFANVLMTCYNIVSVMVKTMSQKNQE